MPDSEGISSRATDLARKLRRNPTPAEVVLWQELRNRNLAGLKFRRQHPVGPYIVDFYCAEHKLVIEVDGDSHVDRRLKDQERTRWLEEAGHTVIRFQNREVHLHLDRVLEAILAACGGR